MSEPKGIPLYQAWVKATSREGGRPRYSPSWALARRAWFRVFPGRIECGDWTIRTSDIDDAVLYEARQWFVPVQVLALTAGERSWQFGFNPWARVGDRLPFPVRRERVRLRYSVFSLLVRAAVLGWLVYLLWERVAR